MHITTPPTLETFSHWPSWLNAYGNLDRSACFELRVSQVRRLAGCIPLRTGPTGKVYEDKRRRRGEVPDLPNERRARTTRGRVSVGHYDITARELDWLARQQFPRRLAGDWRTGRAPGMRRVLGAGVSGLGYGERRGMSLEQGGHGPGERAYERKLNCRGACFKLLEGLPDDTSTPSQPNDEGAGPHRESAGDTTRQPPAPASREGGFKLPAPARMRPGLPIGDLDAGLDGNPNRGATREKRFGLNEDWVQRLAMEKHANASVSGVRYYLVCPGHAAASAGEGAAQDTSPRSMSAYAPAWVDQKKGIRKDPCNRTAYKLFWVLGRPSEHRDAILAEQWLASLDSRQLARQSAAVSALIDRYGPIMGDDRLLRCRNCLNMRYGKSPEAARKNRQRRRRRRARPAQQST